MDQWNKPLLGNRIDPEHPLARGLVGAWIINENSGNRIHDISRNLNSGIIHGSKWVPGPSLEMNGTASDFVELSWPIAHLVSMPFSITAIGRHFVGESSNTIIFSDASATRNSFFLNVDGGTNKVRAAQYGAVAFTAAISIASLADHERYIATGLYISNTERWIYLNNEAGVVDTTDCGAFTWNNLDSFNIGRLERPAPAYYESRGFELLYIHNRFLTPQEIWELHTNPYGMFEQKPLWSLIPPVRAMNLVNGGLVNEGLINAGLAN